MVLQRIQTLWLLLATVTIVLTGIMPTAVADGQTLYVNEYPVLLTIDILVVIMTCLAIFTYRNLRLQKHLVLVSLCMTVVFAAACLFYGLNTDGCVQVRIMSAVFVLIAVISEIMAYRGIRRDQKRLRDSDRLWS